MECRVFVTAIASVILTVIHTGMDMMEGGGGVLVAACGLWAIQFLDNATRLLSYSGGGKSVKEKKKKKDGRSVAVDPSPSPSPSTSAADVANAGAASSGGDFDGDSEWNDDSSTQSTGNSSAGLFQAESLPRSSTSLWPPSRVTFCLSDETITHEC